MVVTAHASESWVGQRGDLWPGYGQWGNASGRRKVAVRARGEDE